ncbi:hypothetical protein DEU41_2792 [Bacillus sp. AG1163]|uniref:hypothetical protein n=1 Tax=Bacillus sp. AG1163 TaxID=2183999 RepID=UPI0010654D9D|nr:hypothetical protein [Bacillus sp. AG1163]TDT85304.1 hypothetical protein DEU41_2792 [Bacillus sp. AG1163]
MKRQNVSSAIGALTTLFYVHQDTEMGMKTMEFYVELGLLENASLVAEILEETRSCDLIHVIKLFDMPTAEQIEDILKGATL